MRRPTVPEYLDSGNRSGRCRNRCGLLRWDNLTFLSDVGDIHRLKTTRILLTQSLVQSMSASLYPKRYHEQVKDQEIVGRGRIVLVRKLCGIMRQMVLTGQFREANTGLHNFPYKRRVFGASKRDAPSSDNRKPQAGIAPEPAVGQTVRI